jgi:hypothetical protein
MNGHTVRYRVGASLTTNRKVRWYEIIDTDADRSIICTKDQTEAFKMCRALNRTQELQA